MDTIQAAILNFRLKNLEKVIEKRRANASFYFKNLKNKNLILPFEKHYEFNTYHTFVVQCRQRNNLQKYLLKNGIETGIHYPIPIHLQDASSFLKYKKGDFPMTENQSKQILTLPIHQFLKKTELKYIINQINKFYD